MYDPAQQRSRGDDRQADVGPDGPEDGSRSDADSAPSYALDGDLHDKTTYRACPRRFHILAWRHLDRGRPGQRGAVVASFIPMPLSDRLMRVKIEEVNEQIGELDGVRTAIKASMATYDTPRRARSNGSAASATSRASSAASVRIRRSFRSPTTSSNDTFAAGMSSASIRS